MLHNYYTGAVKLWLLYWYIIFNDLSHLGELCPVVLVVTTHYAGDHHLTETEGIVTV